MGLGDIHVYATRENFENMVQFGVNNINCQS